MLKVGMNIAFAVVLALFAVVPTAWGQIEHGTPELEGVIDAVGPASLQVRTGPGQVATVALRPDCTVIVGHNVVFSALAPGDFVAVSGLAIPVAGDEAVVIGRSFMIAAPDVAVQERELVARMFLEAAFRDPDPDRYERKVISGIVEHVEEGRVVSVRTQGGRETVKFGPEAGGTSLKIGSRSDLAKGSTVFMALLPAGVASILVYQ